MRARSVTHTEQGLCPALDTVSAATFTRPIQKVSKPKSKASPCNKPLLSQRCPTQVGFIICSLLYFHLLKRLQFTHALEKLSPSVPFSLWIHHCLTCCNTLPVNLYSPTGVPLSASLLSIYLWRPWHIGQNHFCAQCARTSAFYQCCIAFPLPFLFPCGKAVKSLGQGLQVCSTIPWLWDECITGP